MRLHVRGLCARALEGAPALILEDAAGAHRLLIGVPACEARRLAHELRRTPGCDPSVYTAAAALIGRMRGTDAYVLLDSEAGRTVAEIRWGEGGEHPPLSCAPRDAVVLAVLAGLPILAGDGLARRLRDSPAQDPRGALPDARAWLDRVRPEDFA